MSTSSQSLDARLARVRANLEAQERQLASGRRTTVIAAVVVLVIAGAYFMYSYRQFAEVLTAPKLVAVAETVVDQNLTPAREALTKQINAQAGTWAQGLSKQALDAMPNASQKLEDYVVSQVDDSLNQAVLIQDEQFRTFVRDNREMLDEAFVSLSKSPRLGEETLQQIGAALEEELHTDMDAQAADLFGTLVNLNAKLRRLSTGKNLTTEEQLERRVLMLTNGLKKTQPRSVVVSEDDVAEVSLSN